MEIKGKVVKVGATQQVTDSLKKRELIVEYIESNPQYPETLKFEAIQDRCNLLDNVKKGDDIEVFFNLRGRAHTGKDGNTNYFNYLQLWKVGILNSAPHNQGMGAPTNAATADDDDFPF